jgi:hypothetical protein
MVRKADGSWQPCSNFFCLNLVTEPDIYPLPNMLDFAVKVAGCTSVRSSPKLTCKSCIIRSLSTQGAPEDCYHHPFGLFEYKRMPFGLRNTGVFFLRHVDQIIRDCKAALVWVDNIVIRNHKEHEGHMRKVLQAQENRLIINGEKCMRDVPELDRPKDVGGRHVATSFPTGQHPGISSPLHNQRMAGIPTDGLLPIGVSFPASPAP